MKSPIDMVAIAPIEESFTTKDGQYEIKLARFGGLFARWKVIVKSPVESRRNINWRAPYLRRTFIKYREARAQFDFLKEKYGVLPEVPQ